MWEAEPGIDDGFDGTATGRTFRANRFGLYDMHGNVCEWCRDFMALPGVAPRPGDGLREVAPNRMHADRGGSYAWTAGAARSADRFADDAEFRHARLGVRPIRPIR